MRRSRRVIIRRAAPIGEAEKAAYRRSQELKKAYGTWVGRMGWMYFSTLTYTKPIRSYAAWSIFEDYLSRLRTYLAAPIFYYAVAEANASDGTHIHLLLKARGLTAEI